MWRQVDLTVPASQWHSETGIPNVSPSTGQEAAAFSWFSAAPGDFLALPVEYNQIHHSVWFGFFDPLFLKLFSAHL